MASRLLWRVEFNDVIEDFEIIINEDLAQNKAKMYKIDGDDHEYEKIGDLLKYYEVNRINPALPSIGHNFTEKEYKSLGNSNCCCTIL